MKIEGYEPERVKYVVWSFDKEGAEMNIDGDQLTYAQIGTTHHGLQCNYIGGSPRHRLIISKLKKVSELLKQIEDLN